jgi:hypothetical protein
MGALSRLHRRATLGRGVGAPNWTVLETMPVPAPCAYEEGPDPVFGLVRGLYVGATGIEPVTSSASGRIRSPLCTPGSSQLARHRRRCREAVSFRRPVARLSSGWRQWVNGRRVPSWRSWSCSGSSPAGWVYGQARGFSSLRTIRSCGACGANKPSHVPMQPDQVQNSSEAYRFSGRHHASAICPCRTWTTTRHRA